MNIKTALENLSFRLKNQDIKNDLSKIAKKFIGTGLKLNKKELGELISEEVEYEDDLGNVSIPISV